MMIIGLGIAFVVDLFYGILNGSRLRGAGFTAWILSLLGIGIATCYFAVMG